MRITSTLLAVASSIALLAGTAHANARGDMDQNKVFTGTNGANLVNKFNIEKLPKNGAVTVEGTVASIQDGDTFSLSDLSNNQIDVNSPYATQLKTGEKIRVEGNVNAKVGGIDLGQEIEANNIVRINEYSSHFEDGQMSQGTPVGNMAAAPATYNNTAPAYGTAAVASGANRCRLAGSWPECAHYRYRCPDFGSGHVHPA